MKDNKIISILIGDILKKEENVCVSCDEICEYVEKEVKPGDIIRLSLGRCYIPGRVITNNDGIIQLEVQGETIKGLTCIDLGKSKDFIIEVEHECDDKKCTLEAKDE
jgi:hypothetical protein